MCAHVCAHRNNPTRAMQLVLVHTVYTYLYI